MHDESPFIELLVATIELAHRDARRPQKCSLYERGAIRRDALEFLQWAVQEGEELRENLARHIPHRAIRATLLWEMEAHEANATQMYNRRANQKRRGRVSSALAPGKAGMAGGK